MQLHWKTSGKEHGGIQGTAGDIASGYQQVANATCTGARANAKIIYLFIRMDVSETFSP